MNEESGKEEKPNLIGIINEYGALLVKRWKLIAIISGSGTGLVLLFCILTLLLPADFNPMPNKYSSYALLLVDQSAATGGLSSILASYGMAFGGGNDGDDNAGLILTILQSRRFVDMLAEEFSFAEKYGITNKVKTQTRDLILSKTNFTYDAVNSTLRLSYEDTDPVFATEFVNTQIRLLQDWYEEFGGLQTEKELRVLAVQLANQENKISVLEEEIKKFQRENNTLSIEDLANLQATMIGDLRSQKLQIDLQIQTILQFSNDQIEDENLINLRLQRNNIIYLIDQLEQGYSGGEKIMPSLDEMPELAIEYAKLQQELVIQATVYQSLKEQHELAKLNLDRDNFFSVLELAEVPEEKTAPRRSVITVAGAVISLVVAVAVALLMDIVRDFIGKLSIFKTDENED